jgi:DNA-binding FrmR family transcriptional regulator
MITTDAKAHRRIVNRLHRASGQLTAVIAAVENGDSCRDVVTQLAAVASALHRAGYAIVSTAMKDCLTDPEGTNAQDGLTPQELEKLFLMLS